MSNDTEDPALNAALERALGHAPPFAAEELERLEGPLVLRGARDLSGLRRCPNLRHLEVLASDVTDLEPLRGLARLSTLRVACSPLTDAGALAALPALERLDLVFTLVEDAAPVLGLAGLRRAVLLGNPWSDESYGMLRDAAPRSADGPALDISPEPDWRLTRRLPTAGRRACFSHFNGEEILVVPGVPALLNADCDFFKVPRELLELELADPALTIEGLFGRYFPDGRAGPYRTFDFESHHVVGDARDAGRWVADAVLSGEERTALLDFVRRFQGAVFYQEDAALLDRRAQAASVVLPAWLRELRRSLAFIQPHNRVQVRFSGFDRPSAYADQLSSIWYEFGLLGARNPDQRGLVDVNRLFTVAEWAETGHSNLAIRLDDADRRIYEYDAGILLENGALPDDEYRVVFESYASMLGHVAAVKLEDGRVIDARADPPSQ